MIEEMEEEEKDKKEQLLGFRGKRKVARNCSLLIFSVSLFLVVNIFLFGISVSSRRSY
jgi:hypothetical protein